MPEATPQSTPVGGSPMPMSGGAQPPKAPTQQISLATGWNARLGVAPPMMVDEGEGEENETDMYSQRQMERKAKMTQQVQEDMRIKRLMNEQGISFEQNATDMAAGSAEQAGQKYGRELNARIKSGAFTYFIIAIILSLVTDGWNIIEEFLDAGAISTIISIFLDAVMFALLWGEGTWFKRQIIKMLIWPLIAAVVIEFIPIINAFPSYTVGVLLMETEALKELKKNKGALKLLTENLRITGKGKAERNKEIQQRMSQDTFQYTSAVNRQQQLGAGEGEEGGAPPKIGGVEGAGGGIGEAPTSPVMEAA
ncbi:hypothetical protein KKA13_01055 [Patescibacteria group bacterium]|nr:hypothetical protein [Patescibacteria group bacterium]MBU1613480.1 hypothetical protein [Patescibacteria group bacterium]